MAAQNVPQGDNVRSREFVQAVGLSIVRVDAKGMRPTLAVFAERSEQRELQPVARSRMQNESERAGFTLHLVHVVGC